MELAPGDVEAIGALGFVFFLAGEDELAWRQVAAGRAIHPDHVDVLTLEAALTADRPQKQRLYERILEIDPRNHIALENLRELRSESD